MTHTAHEPHYYNATWFCSFALLWWAYSRLAHPLWRGLLAAVHAAAMVIVTVCLIRSIHETQGNRNIHYGSTLRTQINVLDQLGRFHSASDYRNETDFYHWFPTTFINLQIFHPVPESPDAPRVRLVIRYVHPQATDGWLTVAEDK